MNSSSFCNPCDFTFHLQDSPHNFYHKLFQLIQFLNPEGFSVDFFGFFNQGNFDVPKGKFNIFYILEYDWSIREFLNLSNQPAIHFQIGQNNKVSFNGNVDIIFNGYLTNYDFNGIIDLN